MEQNIYLWICEIMKSLKGDTSGDPEWMSISCPTCGTRHGSQITGNQSYVTFGKQIREHFDTEMSNVCTRSLWRPYNFLIVVWSSWAEYPCLNDFETRIDLLNKSSYFETNPSIMYQLWKKKHHVHGIPEYYYLNMGNWIPSSSGYITSI